MSFHRIVRLLAAVLFAALGGVLPGRSVPVDLSNGRLELTVDPAIARITRLALPGGENLLWTTRSPEMTGDWANWGGDKLWWAPQIDWRAVLPLDMWTDTAIDGPWRLLDRGSRHVVVQSPVSPWTGIRARREITLAAASAHVVISNRFTRETANDQRVALWSVTQIRPPLWCWVESQPRPGEPPYVNLRKQFDPSPYVCYEPETGCVRATPGQSDKFMIGTRGSWLAAVYPQVILVERVSPAPDGEYAEQVSLQFFSCEPYVELETLGGLRQLAVGATANNTVEWWVFARPEGLADVALVAWIRAQLAQSPPPGPDALREEPGKGK